MTVPGEDPQQVRVTVVGEAGAGEQPAPAQPEAEHGRAHDGAIEVSVEPLPSHEDMERVTRERDGYLDALQRMKADFDNFRKRMERERVHHRASAAREVVVQVLPVLDNLERAVDALSQQDSSLAGGVDMVRGQLAAMLNGHGLAEVEGVGHPFDPTVHEAIAAVPSEEHPEGTVIEVVEKGYRAGDDLVRAAKVVVAGASHDGPTG